MTETTPNPGRTNTSRPPVQLVDLQAFVLITSAADVGVVLYLAPVVGVALLGSLSALVVLARLVGQAR